MDQAKTISILKASGYGRTGRGYSSINRVGGPKLEACHGISKYFYRMPQQYCEPAPELDAAVKWVQEYMAEYLSSDTILTFGSFANTKLKDVHISYLRNLLPMVHGRWTRLVQHEINSRRSRRSRHR